MHAGFLPMFKPTGPSSAAFVGQVRRLLGGPKVGHTGTLDPAADGLLILAFSRATSLIPYLPTDKRYLAHIKLGVTTHTLDASGRVLERRPVPSLDQARLADVLASFTGMIQQIPPMVSALQVKGKRLYRLARKGVEVDRPPRTVTIYKLELLARHQDELVLDVRCSSGTYIRTLADDIGQALGCGAHLQMLTRTESNGFDSSQVITWEVLSQTENRTHWQDLLVPPEKALIHLPRLQLDDQQARAVCHGQPVKLLQPVQWPADHPGLVIGPDQAFLGMGIITDQQLKMNRVWWPPVA